MVNGVSSSYQAARLCVWMMILYLPTLRGTLQHRLHPLFLGPIPAARRKQDCRVAQTTAFTRIPGRRGVMMGGSTGAGDGSHAHQAFKSSLDLYQAFRHSTDPYISTKLSSALDVIEQTLRLYGPRHVFSSYNGGKDAVVVMHLMRAALANYYNSTQVDDGFRSARPRLIYFANPEEFPEVADFVTQTSLEYNADLRMYSNISFAAGLRACIEEEGSQCLAFLLGTRKGDPNCKEQEVFTPSSTYMPPFMRVNPILEWQYGHVWHFLRHFNLTYCSLYDQGYTSLGNLRDTVPNPTLRRSDGQPGYHAAYMLSDWTLERAGRAAKRPASNGLEYELRDFTQAQRKVKNAKTAGLVIIGDEILKGKTTDTNSLYAARRLRDIGLQVKRISVLSDEHDDIVAEVREQVQKYDVVFTSGGVGPTHDDVTIRAVGSALGQRIQLNEKMLQYIKKAYGVEDLTESQQKMALLPELATLRLPPNSGSKLWPILQCENVFILPGVPQYFESKLDVICAHFLTKRPLFTNKVVVGTDEVALVDALNQVVSDYSDVVFGSYPIPGTSEHPCRVIITMESEDRERLDAARDSLLASIPKEAVLLIEDNDDMLAMAK